MDSFGIIYAINLHHFVETCIIHSIAYKYFDVENKEDYDYEYIFNKDKKEIKINLLDKDENIIKKINYNDNVFELHDFIKDAIVWTLNTTCQNIHFNIWENIIIIIHI